MKKVVKKIAWWVASAGLILNGIASLLLLRVIEWADPLNDCDCGSEFCGPEYQS